MLGSVEVAGLERLSGRMLGRYAARSATRAQARRLESDADREWNLLPTGVYCSAISEGTLVKSRQKSPSTNWELWVHYSAGYGVRLVTEGSWEHVEGFALDVAMHGPPGGPEYHGQQPGWLLFGDDTLHAVTIGGEFRAMPLNGGGHLLLFARNDGGLCVLGVGELAHLQLTAHERLLKFRGQPLHAWLGGQRVPLRGVGAATVLGHIELADGGTLRLGNLAGEHFGLYLLGGETPDCMAMYTLAELTRGDLGQLLRWSHQPHRDDADDADADDDADDDDDADADDADAADGPGPPTATPRAPAPPQTRPERTTTLSAATLELLDRHFTLDQPPEGAGSTILVRLLEGLRMLASRGYGNQLLRAQEIRDLLAERGVLFSCCPRTFSRALAAAIAHTPLLVLVGRRYRVRWGDLLLVDSALLREIAAVTFKRRAPAATASTPPGAPRPPPAAQEPTTEPLSRPAPAASEPVEFGPGVETSDPETEVSDPPVGAEAEFLEHDDEDDSETLPAWLTATGFRRRDPPRTQARGSRLRSRVPVAESASQFKGKKRSGDPP